MPGFLSKVKNKKDLKFNFAKRSAGPIRPNVLPNPFFVPTEKALGLTTPFTTGVYKLTHPDYTFYYYANVSNNQFILDGVEQNIQKEIALFGNPYTYSGLTLTKQDITEDLTFIKTDTLMYPGTYGVIYDILHYLKKNIPNTNTNIHAAIDAAITGIDPTKLGYLGDIVKSVVKLVLLDYLDADLQNETLPNSQILRTYIETSNDYMYNFCDTIGKFILDKTDYDAFTGIFSVSYFGDWESANLIIIANKINNSTISNQAEKYVILCFLLHFNSYSSQLIVFENLCKTMIYYFNDIQGFQINDISKMQYYTYYFFSQMDEFGIPQLIIPYLETPITQVSSEIALTFAWLFFLDEEEEEEFPPIDTIPYFLNEMLNISSGDYYSFSKENNTFSKLSTSGFYIVLITLYAQYRIMKETPCLLEGTLVKTPGGDKRIETLKEGDCIQSQNNKICKILKVGKWPCVYKDRKTSQIVYKVPAGSLNNKTDLFISHHHRISNGFRLLPPHALGFQIASEREITNNGKYTLYHLKIEQGLINYLVVNGGTRVESWL